MIFIRDSNEMIDAKDSIDTSYCMGMHEKTKVLLTVSGKERIVVLTAEEKGLLFKEMIEVSRKSVGIKNYYSINMLLM